MSAALGELWEVVKEAEAAYGTGKAVVGEIKDIAATGRKRASGVKRRFIDEHFKSTKKPKASEKAPLSNLHRSINTGPHGGDGSTTTRMSSGRRAGLDGDEVPIIPPPKKISKIAPEHFTVNLPFVTRTFSSNEANFAHNSTVPWAIIRLNSIYDPLKQTNATIGNPVNDSDIQPQGRHIWDSHFKYYRVLKTYVKLTFVSSRILATGKQARPFNEHYVVGYELIDEDGAISNDVDMFLMTKRAERGIMKPCDTQQLFTSAGIRVSELPLNTVSHTMTYVYSPDQWVHHVEELGSEERWTPILQNPAIDHDLAIRIMHLDKEAQVANAGSIGCFIQVAYDVQFREGSDSFFKTLSTANATYGGIGEDPADD